MMLLFALVQARAQHLGSYYLLDGPKEKNPVLYIRESAYPTFMNEERHGTFIIGFTDKDRALINELHGFYDTYPFSTIFRAALRTKYYTTHRLYVFGDVGSELEQDNQTGRFYAPRFFYQAGSGYDVSPNLNLELRTEQMPGGNPGPYSIPAHWNVRGTIKF